MQKRLFLAGASKIRLYYVRGRFYNNSEEYIDYFKAHLSLQVDRGCCVGRNTTQCGNNRIFLSLRFYVKSKLANLQSQYLPLQCIEKRWI